MPMQVQSQHRRKGWLREVTWDAVTFPISRSSASGWQHPRTRESPSQVFSVHLPHALCQPPLLQQRCVLHLTRSHETDSPLKSLRGYLDGNKMTVKQTRWERKIGSCSNEIANWIRMIIMRRKTKAGRSMLDVPDNGCCTSSAKSSGKLFSGMYHFGLHVGNTPLSTHTNPLHRKSLHAKGRSMGLSFMLFFNVLWVFCEATNNPPCSLKWYIPGNVFLMVVSGQVHLSWVGLLVLSVYYQF